MQYNVIKRIFIYLTVLVLLGVIILNKQQFKAHASASPPQPLGQSGNWNMIFNDEFNGNSLDLNKWKPQELWFAGSNTAISQPVNSAETAAYDPAQNSENGGVLQQTVVKNPVNVNGKTYQYRTGAIFSRNFKFTYGVLEARMYLPASNGSVANWPAWWAVGDNWPQDGEIDVMEGLSGKASWHFHYAGGGPGATPPGMYTGWHIFAADWEPTFIKYYYDGALVGTISNGVTNKPMQIIAANQTGSYGGPVLVPSVMEIDYIRVWQKCTTNCNTSTPSPIPSPTPNNTVISLELLLDGVGSAGDSANPTSKGNTNPHFQQRAVTLQFFNSQNAKIGGYTVIATYNKQTGSFQASSTISTIPSGDYTVKIKADRYLQKTVPGIVKVQTGKNVVIPQTSLVVGDINNDNQINTVDYSILMGCYSDLLPASNCTPQNKIMADLNDDIKVDQTDYNLFMREMNNRVGD